MGRLKVEGVVTGVTALEKGYKCSVLIKKNMQKDIKAETCITRHPQITRIYFTIANKREAAYTHKAHPAMTYPFNQRAFL